MTLSKILSPCARRRTEAKSRLSNNSSGLFICDSPRKNLKSGWLTAIAALAVFISAPAHAIICSTDSNIAIDDGSGSTTPGTPAVITIDTSLTNTGTVTDLDFQLQIDHTYVGDLIVTLESPDGTVITLLDRPGRPVINVNFGCGNDNVDVTLDDSAATLAEDQCSATSPAIGGVQLPTGSLTAFNTETAAGIWTLTVTDNAGQDTGTLISNNACLDLSTTPVTVGSFKSRARGNALLTQWQTSSEAFNLGFNLWGQIEGQWQQLNRRLIPSKTIDSVIPQKYYRKVNVAQYDGEINAVGISALSTSGQEDFFGPFQIGEKYGEDTVPRYIDWTAQRELYDQGMRDAGYLKINSQWVKPNQRNLQRQAKQKHHDQRQQDRFDDVLLEISEAGVYKLTYEELAAQGFKLNRFPLHKLALTRDGNAIPRIIRGDTKRFGPGSEIIFFAQGPDSADSRYTDRARYVISLDRTKVLNAPQSGSVPNTNLTADQSHYQWLTVGDKNIYSIVMPGNDPWYDSALRAFGAPSIKELEFDVPNAAMLDQAAQIRLNLLGGIKFQNIDADGDGELEPNHHYRVYLNRDSFPEPVFEGYADGIDPIDIQLSVNEQLKHGVNKVSFELIPDNGFNIDAAYFIDASLGYTVENQFNGGQLNFTADTVNANIAISDAGELIERAYSFDADGNFAELNVVRSQIDQGDGQLSSVATVASPKTSASESAPSVWLAAENGYLSPARLMTPTGVDQNELDLSETDYVLIADPSLIGDDLRRFQSKQIELGRRTKIVSSQAVFDAYSDGLALPRAIADYLKAQSAQSAYQYVLLVGGHTYNYLNHNTTSNNEIINLIPSFYRSTGGFTKQIPTTVPFVDFDHDGAPDKAIGRWPVRDSAQLKNVISKTLAWHAEGSHKDSKQSVFIAGAEEPLNNFSQSSDRVASALGLATAPWLPTNKVYMDTINQDDSVAADQKIAVARQSLVDAINKGAALTVFSGHASTTLWSYQNLLNADIADDFENNGTPTLMVPLACYTSYYETPNIKSLAEILLMDSEQAAVAISSAALLSRPSDNEMFAKNLLKEMTVNGLDLGSAVMKVKQSTHAYSPRHQTIVYNWTTLGDPTISFNLPKLTPVTQPNTPKTVMP